MTSHSAVITHIDAERLAQAIRAGIANVLKRRDYINSINVFPVPDSDTGTNLAFTLASVRKAIEQRPRRSLPELLELIAEAAIDGARGNSGAIMAQYFQGLSEIQPRVPGAGCQPPGGRVPRRGALGLGCDVATGCGNPAQRCWKISARSWQSWPATAWRIFASSSARVSSEPDNHWRTTPEQLAVLKDAGVVDAGAQGFVDFLEWHLAFHGPRARCPRCRNQSNGATSHEHAGRDSKAPGNASVLHRNA